MEDRRSVKSKKAISEAFLSLLEKKSLKKITVTEISRIADLGRGTFYLHYRDVYDLYSHIENERYNDLIEIFESYFPTAKPNNTMKLTETITEYIEDNKEIFLLLISSENGSSLHRLKTIFNEKVLFENSSVSHTNYDRVKSTFIVSGIVGVLEEWLKQGLSVSQKDIAIMLNDILIQID